MDNQKLERLLSKWQKQLRKKDYLEDGVIEELEDHVVQSVKRLVGEGHSLDDAFEEAVESIGKPFELNEQEFHSRSRTNRTAAPLLLSYFLIAMRRLKRKKLIIVINTLGLALGVAVSVLLGVYSYDIITYDQFHENAEDIYFLYRTRPTPEGGQLDVSDTWAPLAEEVQNEFPQVENIGRIVYAGRTGVRFGDQDFRENMMFTDQGLFDMFSFPFDRGNPSEVFRNPNSVVLSHEVAERIFGDKDPIGETIQLELNELTEYQVTGVLGEIPFNSSLQFELVVNVESRRPLWEERGFWGWGASFMFSFIQLSSGTDHQDLVDQFPLIVEKFINLSEKGTLELMPLKEYYDFNTGEQQYGYFLGYIAIGLLVIAFFNFTNLNAAQSLARFKEVAVRKVFGALRADLVTQFIGETTLLLGIGVIIGIALALLTLQEFIDLFGQQMSLDFLFGIKGIILILAGIILFGIMAGLYPTVTLSRLKALETIHGTWLKTKEGFDPKNILVTIQFGIAVMLVSAVIIMYQQISFMKTADMKFDPDNVMLIEAGAGSEDGIEQLTSFRNSIEALPGVQSVSSSNSAPGWYSGSYILVQSDDAMDKPPLDWRFVQVDDQYFSTMDIQFTEGRDFNVDLTTDVRKVVLNQAAVEQLGWSSIEGHELMFPNSDEGLDVVGVVEDFNYESLVSNVQPVIHQYRGHNSERYRMLLVRLNDQAVGETLEQIRGAWDIYDPNTPMQYSFIDDNFRELYETEERMGEMTLYATVIAIFVAILGILGLASFSVVERMKEMAIRKVLGASVRELIILLVKHTTILLVIGLLVAVPVNYFMMTNWLDDFAYRISVNPVVYICAGLIILATAWVVIGGFAIKSIKTNPAKTLRSE